MVVIGHDFDVLFLFADIEPALAVDVFSGKLGCADFRKFAHGLLLSGASVATPARPDA
jgi:hypothetical protein